MYPVTVIDINGDYNEREIDISELLDNFPSLAKYDFRVIDERYDLSVSDIRVKQNIIIAKIDYIRTIIDVDRVYVFMSTVKKINSLIHEFIICVQNSLIDNSEKRPMELVILEDILKCIYENYDGLVDMLTPEVIKISRSVSDNIFSSNLKYSMISVQTKHIDLHGKIKDIKDNLHEISNDWGKEELAELNISDKISKEDEEELERKRRNFQENQKRIQVLIVNLEIYLENNRSIS